MEITKTLLERLEARLGLTPARYLGETADGAGPMLAWLVDEKAIAPHVPVWDQSERSDGTCSRSDFPWDAAADVSRCPEGKALRSGRRPFKAPRTRVTKDNTSHRKIARALAKTPEYRHSRCERKKLVVRSAHLNRLLKLDRFGLRARTGANDTSLLAATAQNLRRPAKLGAQAPPEHRSGASACDETPTINRNTRHRHAMTGPEGGISNSPAARAGRLGRIGNFSTESTLCGHWPWRQRPGKGSGKRTPSCAATRMPSSCLRTSIADP